MTDLVRRVTGFSGIALIATLTAVLGAQGQVASARAPLPSKEAIESWLHSGEPRMEAWGAHYVLITRDQDLIPDLVSLANQWQPLIRQACDRSPCSELSSEEPDEQEAMASVLDALIQLKATVPTDTLRNLAPDFATDVAILLPRLPSEESNALALELYHSPPEHGDVLRYIGATLLARHPPYGFASDLLASIQVHAMVVVVALGSTASGNGMGSGSCGNRNMLGPRQDWPAVGQYMLLDQKSDNSAAVLDGVDPLYSVRLESTYYLGDTCQMMVRVKLDPTARLKLIAEMLGVSPETIPWQTSFVTRIEFKSVEQVDTAILDLAEEQREKYRQTANALAERGLLAYSDVEASLPKLQIEIQDTRDPVSIPIIPLPLLPTGVSW